MRRAPIALLAATLLVAGCNAGKESGSDETRKQTEQVLATTKDIATQTRATAESTKTTADTVRTLSGQVDALQKAMTTALAAQKRGALVLRLDQEATCDNDPECTATARAVCERINYPNALTMHFAPGLRPTLQSLICFD